jgi:hypothetical protein
MTTTIQITITRPDHMGLIKVARVQTYTHTVDTSPDRAMANRIAIESPMWPGPGQNFDRHVPVKANPGGAYLGSF